MVGNYKIDFLIPYVGVGINCLEFYIENILGTTAKPENINIIVSHHSQEDLKILENSKIYKKIYKVIYAKKDEPNHHWHASVSHTNALNELYKNISSDIVIFSDYDMAFVEKNWDEYIVAELIDNNIDILGVNYPNKALPYQFSKSEQPGYAFKYQKIPNLSFFAAKEATLKKYFPKKISNFDEMCKASNFKPLLQITSDNQSKIYNLPMHNILWADTGINIPKIVFENNLQTKLIFHEINLAHEFFKESEKSKQFSPEIFSLNKILFLAHYKKGTFKERKGIDQFNFFKNDVNNYLKNN